MKGARINAGLAGAATALAADERGQAMTEYAIIAWALLIGTISLSKFFLPLILDAYQFYFDVFFFILNLPIP
jgi:hypothetical protein